MRNDPATPPPPYAPPRVKDFFRDCLEVVPDPIYGNCAAGGVQAGCAGGASLPAGCATGGAP